MTSRPTPKLKVEPMPNLKKTCSGLVPFLFAVFAAACHPVERTHNYGGPGHQDDAGALDAESNSLIKQSASQESFLTFQGLAADRPAHPFAGQPMTAMVSLAVSGQMGEEEGTIWHALAASFASSTARTLGDDEGGLYLNDAGIVSLVGDSGKVVELGKLEEVGLDHPITLNPGVEPILMVESGPFDVSRDEKNAPGMSMAFAVP